MTQFFRWFVGTYAETRRRARPLRTKVNVKKKHANIKSTYDVYMRACARSRVGVRAGGW